MNSLVLASHWIVRVVVNRVGEPGYLAGKSARLVIKRLWVQILAGVAREFSSPEWTLCAYSYSYSTPVLLQRHVKDPGHSAKSAGGRLHLNRHTSLFQWSQSGLTMPLSRHSMGTYLETSSHNLSGNIQPQLSQLAEPLWTDPGVKSEICVGEWIST